VPLSKTGAELLLDTFSQRHERASTLVTSNLPFEEWAEFARSIGNASFRQMERSKRRRLLAVKHTTY
jgi:DNA replication protein DnaC